MTWSAGVTAVVLAGLMAAMASNRVGADVVMLGGLTILLVSGVIGPADAFSGFANEGLLTVGFLYVVVAGLRHSGAVNLLTDYALGRPRSDLDAQARVAVPVTAISAFMANTPLVALYLPMLDAYARRYGIAPSRLFLPLSYAAILGGVCTLVGTSTNMVVNGLILEANAAAGGAPLAPMRMFTLTPIGVPVAVAGVAYMLLAGRRLLLARQPIAAADDDARHYTVAMRVEPSAPIVGRSLERAGLRHLSGLFLAHIERAGVIHHAVAPHEVLRGGDTLVFVGVLASVVDLQQVRGLTPLEWDPSAGHRQGHRLIEAVISPGSPLVGRTIRDGEFRTRYGGVIVAVHRHGERLKGKLGDIRIRPGDTLLIEAAPGFARRHRDSRAFHLVSEHDGAVAPRHDRAWMALVLLVGFIVVSSVGWLDTLTAALLTGGLMLACRCTDGAMARQAIDWQVLTVIGAGIGVGRAMEASGLVAIVANAVVGATAGLGPVGLLSGVYALTWLLTSVLSNTAAAVLVFPIALAAARASGYPAEPFTLAIAVAASCEFTTPVGYQTNLMVQGPGGYRAVDYWRFGGPLTAICAAVAITALSWRYF